MQPNTTPFSQQLLRFGFGLNMFMAAILLLSTIFYKQRSSGFFDDNAFFFIGYLPTLIYALVVFTSRFGHKRRKLHFPTFKLTLLALSAFSISAYILNRSMGLFESFVTWTIPVLIGLHLVLILSAFREKLPTGLRVVLAFIAGFAMWFSLAQTIHLAELMPLSAAICWFFGVSVHTFVPLFIILALAYDFVQHGRKEKATKWSFIMGLSLPVILITIFLVRWHDSKMVIHEAKAAQITQPKNQLPEWVRISQAWNMDWISERIVMGSMVYDMPDTRGFSGLNGLREGRKYDPLVSLAIGLFEDMNISKTDRIKIYESQFDGRHNTHRKLWSGKNLSTTDVLTEIKVTPEFANAYVEKTLTIKNNKQNGWPREEEALYTFSLPEGAVATSLSLWINGVEEKSRLTTKGKADSAYVQIVGRERRDPALMHWQEGNQITVTVFPCTNEEDRKFKIGATVPLNVKDDALWLENIYFKGPDFSAALETTVVHIDSDQKMPPILPDGFEIMSPGNYVRSGDYEPFWKMGFPNVALSPKTFTFDSLSYQLRENEYVSIAREVEHLYLDINAEWTDDEVKQAMRILDPSKTSVFIDEFHTIDQPGMDKTIERVRDLRFTMFPFHALEHSDKVVILTKSTVGTPNLRDLNGSKFQSSLERFLAESTTPPIVIDLSERSSAYLQTMRQFRSIDLRNENLASAVEQIGKGTFPMIKLKDNAVEIGNSGYHILRSELHSEHVPGGNDHLMRLYNYNRILKDIRQEYFVSDHYAEGSLIDMANAAFVVSPISSLVVLETVKDYDRFDIEKNKNSLQNANMNSSGSVPEPHEWLLIILALCIPLYHFIETKRRRVSL